MKGIDLTLRDLTINESNSLLFVLDSLRSGKGVEVRVFEQGHGAGCEDGSCAVPEVSEPVAVDTPYKPNDEVVEATYKVDEKPKKKGKKPAKKVKKAAAPAEEVQGTADATLLDTAPAPVAEPAPVVAVPSVTKVDVDNAMAAVFKKSGMTGAKALLGEFAATRSRDLPVEKYAAFIARANEIVGS